MPHSKVVNETERWAANRIFARLREIEKELESLNRERAELAYIRDQVMKTCQNCGGSGTSCEGRTADDMPDYQVCRPCGGKGHGRG